MTREQQLIEWLDNQGLYRPDSLLLISGDASFRRYFRFETPENEILIGVDAPVDTENNPGFVAIAEGLLRVNVPVPIVHAVNYEQGFMALSDGGDELLSQHLSSQTFVQRYNQSLECLLNIQACKVTQDYALPAFDSALLKSEFSLFTEWLLKVHLDYQTTPQQEAMLIAVYDSLEKIFFEQPQVFVHRDYHCRNILLKDDSPFIIDFQDAVTGPVTYDAVSLLRDCYVRWPQDAILDILAAWHREHFSEYSWEQFKRWFDLTGIQRHIKAAGIFARLNHRDGKSGYLNDIPNTLQYIVEVARDYPELMNFSTFVEKTVLPMVEAKLL